jgi:prepilin-type N-terminal cleavage/methylation domain-containing protein
MKGFTLIEVIISVLLLAVILLGGTTLFYQNLKSAGLSDVDSQLNNTEQSILRSVEKDIRFSEVNDVGLGTRLQCLAAGSDGLQGETLSVTNLDGRETTYSLSTGKLASTSAETGQVVFLNPANITIETLQFTWYCMSGVSDKIKMAVSASSNALGTGIKVEQSASLDINLLNSGLN